MNNTPQLPVSKTNPSTLGRRRIFAVLFGLGLLALALRALDLQVLRNDFLRQQAEARQVRSTWMPARRGVITDRKGEVLASSDQMQSVWLDAKVLQEGYATALKRCKPEAVTALQAQYQQGLQTLQARLELKSGVINQHIQQNRRFVYLKRRVPQGLADQLAGLKLPGVGFEPEFQRYYPAAEVAAHIVGVTGRDDQDGREERGREGLELALDTQLRGESGQMQLVHDGKRRPIRFATPPHYARDGQDVQLSIDLQLQAMAYRGLQAAVAEHQAKGGSMVILDARSGEVLAMVNQPSFNPNLRGDIPLEFRRNQALTDTFEPGSTMKAFTLASALESGRYKPTTLINTAPGSLHVGRHRISDVHPNGTLTVAGVLQKSSNVGTVKIALSLDSGTMWTHFRHLGFGQRIGTQFPGETSGSFSHYKRWKPIDKAVISFGYSLSVNAVQLARAYTALATDGRVLPVSFLHQAQAPMGERVFSPRTAQTLRDMLELAAGDHGTGQKSQVPGYRVAGKTGTAHKVVGRGYANRYRSLFAGMIPASQPRLVAVVVIDEPSGGQHYGGAVAAPVFGRVMTEAMRYLNIPPDTLPPELAPSLRQAAQVRDKPA